MLLYDRDRISQKNHWLNEDGYVYSVFPITEISLNQEITVKMTNFNTIIDDMFPLEDKTEYINALGIVFSVIDRRYRSGRPLIVF